MVEVCFFVEIVFEVLGVEDSFSLLNIYFYRSIWFFLLIDTIEFHDFVSLKTDSVSQRDQVFLISRIELNLG